MITDPCDNTILEERWTLKRGKRFDGSSFPYYCSICNTHVFEKSKHCGACNKCIQNFDHHCKWLNTCIGSKNYWSFFTLICISNAYSIIHIAIGCVSFGHSIQSAQIIKIPKFVFLSTSICSHLLFFFSLLYLMIFHIYIKCKGTSTYEFMKWKQPKWQSRVKIRKQNSVELH